MEVSTEKSKSMTSNTNNFSADISMKSQKSEELTSFKYLESTLCKVGSSPAQQKYASELPRQWQQWPE